MIIAQTRNLGKAAALLRLTQPAISKTLSELEDIVGVRLIERSRQGTKLTRDGEGFLRHAVKVLNALNAAGAAVGVNRPRQREIVRVGVLPTVAPDLLPPTLASFREERADTHVVVQTATNAAPAQSR